MLIMDTSRPWAYQIQTDLDKIQPFQYCLF